MQGKFQFSSVEVTTIINFMKSLLEIVQVYTDALHTRIPPPLCLNMCNRLGMCKIPLFTVLQNLNGASGYKHPHRETISSLPVVSGAQLNH